MELIPETKFTLPSYLQGRNTFVLHVNVTPVNDPPVLNLLPGKVLRLTQVYLYYLYILIEIILFFCMNHLNLILIVIL